MSERREFLKSLVAGTAVAGLPPVESIESLGLKAGDTIVLSYAGHMEAAVMSRLQHIMEERFPDHKCLILTNGLKLQVLRA